MYRRILLSLVVASAAACAPTSAQTAMAPPARTIFDGPARTTLSTPVVNVPLTKVGQYYYVDVRVNDTPLRFTLETGAGFFSISERAAGALGLKVDSVEVFPGMRLPVAPIQNLAFHGASFDGLVARVSPLFNAWDFDGIISIPVLKDLLATIDLGNAVLRLEQGVLPAPNNRDVFAVAGKDRGRRIDMEISLGATTVPAVLDSRSYLPIMISDTLGGMLRLSDTPRPMGNARGPSQGTFTLAAAHLAGDLRIGDFGVTRPALALRNRSGAVLGVPFLEQFAITIDQRNQRVRLARPGRSAIATIPPQYWETDSSGPARPAPATPSSSGAGAQPRLAGPPPTDRPMGFNLAGASAELRVINLVPGSNADKAGIRNDDRLVEFDGTPVAAMSQAVFRSAIARGTPVKVVVTREGKRLEFMIQPQSR